MGLLDLRLSHAALLIAQDEYPKLRVLKYLKRLDAMATEIQSRVCLVGRSVDTLEDRLSTVVQYLFSEQKFQGNSLDYYDPKNSFLNEVIDRRLGLPITLSILTLEMCQKVGLNAWGVGLPTHFMVGVEVDRGRKIIVDPFHAGAILDPGALQARLRNESASTQLVMDNRAILTRLLNNLKLIYWNEKRFDKALPVLERLVQLNPEQATEFRDRGLAYYQNKKYAHALLDIERYLMELDSRRTVRDSSSTAPVSPENVDERFFLEELARWLRGQVPVSTLLH